MLDPIKIKTEVEDRLAKPLSGEAMCEAIAAAGFLRVGDRNMTAEEIWNYSPTGELAMVYIWYRRAIFLDVVAGHVIGDAIDAISAALFEQVAEPMLTAAATQ